MAAERASDIAYRNILDAILNLHIEPGSLINEQAIADRFELGRASVRSAFVRLARDRFLTILPRKGTIVTPMTLDDILDMFEAREAIECGVVYIAATHATESDLETLRGLVEKVDRARMSSDYEEFLRDDHAVHTFLVRMVRNSLLQDAAALLLLHSLRFWRFYWNRRPARTESMLSHADLMRALESRDPEKAEDAMRQHLRRSWALVRLFGPLGTADNLKPLPNETMG